MDPRRFRLFDFENAKNRIIPRILLFGQVVKLGQVEIVANELVANEIVANELVANVRVGVGV